MVSTSQDDGSAKNLSATVLLMSIVFASIGIALLGLLLKALFWDALFGGKKDEYDHRYATLQRLYDVSVTNRNWYESQARDLRTALEAVLADHPHAEGGVHVVFAETVGQHGVDSSAGAGQRAHPEPLAHPDQCGCPDCRRFTTIPVSRPSCSFQHGLQPSQAGSSPTNRLDLEYELEAALAREDEDESDSEGRSRRMDSLDLGHPRPVSPPRFTLRVQSDQSMEVDLEAGVTEDLDSSRNGHGKVNTSPRKLC